MITEIQELFLLPIFDTYLNARMSISNISSVCAIQATQPQRVKANGENLCFKKLDSDSFVLMVWTLFYLSYVIGTWMKCSRTVSCEISRTVSCEMLICILIQSTEFLILAFLISPHNYIISW
jgi:hypothetical protein